MNTNTNPQTFLRKYATANTTVFNGKHADTTFYPKVGGEIPANWFDDKLKMKF